MDIAQIVNDLINTKDNEKVRFKSTVLPPPPPNRPLYKTVTHFKIYFVHNFISQYCHFLRAFSAVLITAVLGGLTVDLSAWWGGQDLLAVR